MKKHYAPRGFTLIEMLVSIALFSVVMVVALGALLSMSVSVRTATATNSAINNLSSAMDSISRLVRTGTNYHCGSGGVLENPQDCPTTPDGFFAYRAFDGSQVTYCLSDPAAPTQCSSATPKTTCPTGKSCTILRKIGSGGYVTLTAPEVNITYLAFYTEGAALGDNIQPKMTVVVSGTVPVTNTQSSNFNIQTAVTQRVYDQ